jgi:hypothetical protein
MHRDVRPGPNSDRRGLLQLAVPRLSSLPCPSGNCPLALGRPLATEIARRALGAKEITRSPSADKPQIRGPGHEVSQKMFVVSGKHPGFRRS